MILPALFFYLFAGVCVASAVMVIVSRNPVHSVLYLILAFVNASGLFVLIKTFIVPDSAAPAIARGTSNTRELGRVIFTEYLFAFEVAAMILLVAIVAAVALTLRKRKDTKGQVPSKQIAVKRADRIRMVSMPSEKVRRPVQEP